MKRLYFIRHGLSEMNKVSVWSGSPDSPLAPEGREQAKQAGQKAKAQGFEFDLIISSPRQRAYDTAKYVAAAVGYPIDKILVMEEIVERDFGSLEGRRDLVAATHYALKESAIDKHEGVEKLDTLQKRADDFYDFVCDRPEEVILVAGHGAFGRALYRKINNKPMSYRFKIYKNADMERLV